MPNFGYHAARWKGAAFRRSYQGLLPLIIRNQIKTNTTLPLDVFSYSGEASIPEQVLSIRSFIKHAGRPNRFVVVTDGTHSPASLEILRRTDVSVTVIPVSERLLPDLPAQIHPYLMTHPTGKQLAVVMSLPDELPALYVDSDVLFFKRAANLRELVATMNIKAYYLADCQLSADERLFRSTEETASPVNTGLLLFHSHLDWSLGIARLLDLHGAEPTFFTNQTVTHLTMHANGAKTFDSSDYVLSLRDQFVYRDLYAGENIAARHYVNPVRHKMWSSLGY